MTLTDAERDRITRCIDEHGGVCREVMCDDSLDVLVASIVAARVAQVTADRARVLEMLRVQIERTDRVRIERDALVEKISARGTREWAQSFLDEWSRPYFGDDSRDAVAAVLRAAEATDRAVLPS
jgi:hypothetical protein